MVVLMNPTDKVTHYRQVQQSVEDTYERVMKQGFPGNVSISVLSSGSYVRWTGVKWARDALRDEVWIRKAGDVIEGATELTYTIGCLPNSWLLRLLHKLGAPFDPAKHSVVVVSNPMYIVVSQIFHGIGHSLYSEKTQEYNRELEEVTAYLTEDELALAHDSPHPGFWELYHNEMRSKGEFHKKCRNVASKFRPKVQLHGLPEKVDFALRCSSLEELEKRLPEIL